MSMEKYYTPTEWENYPSEDTAINAMRLNHAEDGINELDDRIVELSTDKSEVDWNQILLSGEKIAEITINGIKKNVYNSNDSAKAEAQAYKAEGYATGEQNGIPVESGSPYYHNNSKYFSEESASHAEESSGFADDAEESSFDAEAWAVGERDGVPVPSTDPTYNNNAKHYCEEARHFTPEGYEELIQDVEDLKVDKIDKTAVDEKTTTTGQFETINGGKLESCVINIEPKQSGSGTPSPSNVRPITGHSSVEVWEHGKNYLPITLSDIKSANTTGTWSGNVYSINGITITILTDNDNNVIGIKRSAGTPSSTIVFNLYFCSSSSDLPFDLNSAYILNGCPSGGGTNNNYKVDAVYKKNGVDNILMTDIGNGAQANFNSLESSINITFIIVLYANSQSEKIFYPMLRLATETDATFAPYQGQDVTVNLGGTYYGGSLDAVSGVLTVDKGYTKIKNLSWYTQSSAYAHFITLSLQSVIKKSNSENIAISDIYKSMSNDDSQPNINQIYSNISGDLKIGDIDYNNSSVEDWIAERGESEIVYKLAEPLTIQLTPTQINTLIGENHLDIPLEGQSLDSAVYRELFAWDDVNDVVELRLPISAIGTDESKNDAASQAYSQGDYFYKNGIAKAKTSIASGATFTLGTNYEIKTLAEILKALES